MSKHYYLLFWVVFIAACVSSDRKVVLAEMKQKTTIHPSSIVLNKKRQFAIVSEELDSVTVIGGKSVVIEQGKIDPGGRSLKVYITVLPLEKADSLDKAGKRIIQIHSRQGKAKVILNVIDEKKE